MTAMIKKLAHASRIFGHPLYDVTYPGHRDMDMRVPWSYLKRLQRSGYRVEVSDREHGDTTLYPESDA